MQFSDFGSRSVLAAFDGGEITSDAGALLLRETANKLSLFTRLADCFDDHRDQRRVERRIKISMPDACPYQQIFFTAWNALRAQPAPI